MTPNEKPDFVTTMTALFETFGREVTDAQLLGYWMGLEDLPLTAIQAAVRRAIRECERFVPTPAELRRLSGESTPEDAALMAWTELQQNIGSGPYNHVSFRDPVINATIRAMCGNWVAMCDRFAEGESHEKWLMKDFIRFYMSCARRTLGDEETKALPGLATGQIDQETGELIAPVPVLLGKPRDSIRYQRGSESARVSLASPDDV